MTCRGKGGITKKGNGDKFHGSTMVVIKKLQYYRGSGYVIAGNTVGVVSMVAPW